MFSGYKKSTDGATRASWPTPLIHEFCICIQIFKSSEFKNKPSLTHLLLC